MKFFRYFTAIVAPWLRATIWLVNGLKVHRQRRPPRVLRHREHGGTGAARCLADIRS